MRGFCFSRMGRMKNVHGLEVSESASRDARALAPVSYTHLDVYKRQDMDGTLLPTFAQQLSSRVLAALRAAHDAGITIAIATGRRYAYTVPILESLGLPADMPLVTSNGAVIRTLSGEAIHCDYMQASVARQLCGLLRPFGAVVFTFDRPGRGELVLEDLEQTHGRISLWVEANRNAIEVIKPLERAFDHGEDPIQGICLLYTSFRKA